MTRDDVTRLFDALGEWSGRRLYDGDLGTRGAAEARWLAVLGELEVEVVRLALRRWRDQHGEARAWPSAAQLRDLAVEGDAPPAPDAGAPGVTWHTLHAEWAARWPGGCPEPSPSIVALDAAIAEDRDASDRDLFARALELLQGAS